MLLSIYSRTAVEAKVKMARYTIRYNRLKESIDMFHFGIGPGFALWGIIPLIGSLLWFVLLIALIWGLIRLFSKRTPMIGFPMGPLPQQPQQPPMYQASQPPATEILRQRYARGEIDDATFQQMRERLEASVPPQQQQF